MFSKPLALVFVGVGCIAAAGIGAYVAVRQNIATVVPQATVVTAKPPNATVPQSVPASAPLRSSAPARTPAPANAALTMTASAIRSTTNYSFGSVMPACFWYLPLRSA